MNGLSVFLFCAMLGVCLSARGQEKGEKAGAAEMEAPPVSPEMPANLYTRVYVVPKTFVPSLYSEDGPPRDPFAEQDGKGKVDASRRSLRSLLEGLGMEFGKGASMAFNAETAELAMRNTEEQHEILEAYLDSLVANGERQVHLLLEYIEVEMEDFSAWLLDNKVTADATPMRKVVQEWVDDRDAFVIESSMITARSGQRAKVESVREFIYPTEYDPPEIPGEVSLSGRADSLVTSVAPTAFETRNVGHTFEVDPVLGKDGETVYLNLAPEVVEHEGYTHWPSEEADVKFRTSLPTFYAMKITTQITVRDGRYGFLGTTRPRVASNKRMEDPVVLQFVRADVGNVVEWSVRDGEVEREER